MSDPKIPVAAAATEPTMLTREQFEEAVDALVVIVHNMGASLASIARYRRAVLSAYDAALASSVDRPETPADVTDGEVEAALRETGSGWGWLAMPDSMRADYLAAFALIYSRRVPGSPTAHMVDDLATLVRRLAHAVRDVNPQLSGQATDYLARQGFTTSPLRAGVSAGAAPSVTEEDVSSVADDARVRAALRQFAERGRHSDAIHVIKTILTVAAARSRATPTPTEET